MADGTAQKCGRVGSCHIYYLNPLHLFEWGFFMGCGVMLFRDNEIVFHHPCSILNFIGSGKFELIMLCYCNDNFTLN